jgi:hypothetical protein
MIFLPDGILMFKDENLKFKLYKIMILPIIFMGVKLDPSAQGTLCL